MGFSDAPMTRFPIHQHFLTIQQFLARQLLANSMNCVGPAFASAPGTDGSNRGERTLRIDKNSQGGKTTIRMIGHFHSEHVDELKKQIQDNGPRFVLDLKEVTVVDLEVVRFLGTCKAGGVRFVFCPQYIKEWMARERKRKE